MAFTQSMLAPAGTISSKVPCIFGPGLCRNDPRGQSKMTSTMTGVAWGSALPQIAAFVAALSDDPRFAAGIAGAAEKYAALLQRYANNASSAHPELLNVTSTIDGYNTFQQGWPASAYGDWCPANIPGKGGCSSVSALLNSVYFILDVDAAAALATMAGAASSARRLASWAAEARNSFSAAFLRNISVAALPPNRPVAGLAYRDLARCSVTHHGNTNTPPSAQVEAAAGMAAMDTSAVDSAQRGALGAMLAGLLLNVSGSRQGATQVGGVIDMAQLGRSLASYGRADAAFALLTSDSATSLYHMANSTGTLWAHPSGADGYRGRCSSHNHVMMAGSVGEAIWTVGGISPSFVRGETFARELRLGPVPWLPDAPRGAAVWRTAAGAAATRWAAAADAGRGPWRLWVNATVPVGGGRAVLRVMLPEDATARTVCAWECGLAGAPPAAFASSWVAFDVGGGHWRQVAVPPPAAEVAADAHRCVPLWERGPNAVPGVASVAWSPIVEGREQFPALELAVESGEYAVYAERCAAP